jgi:RNA polymerase sigma-70 factor, ECF subfamily
VLSNVDRELLQRCLDREPGGWELFVNRFIGLTLQVIQHTANSRSIALSDSVRDELVSDVFTALLESDFAVLRRFRGGSSLATYLTVVVRRIVVRRLMRRKKAWVRERSNASQLDITESKDQESFLMGEEREAIEHAMSKLSTPEATAVRMFYFEGRSYREISTHLGMAENSMGPYLSRARTKLKENIAD